MLALPMAETSPVLGLGYSLMQLDVYRTIVQLQTKISYFSTISHTTHAATNSDLAYRSYVNVPHKKSIYSQKIAQRAAQLQTPLASTVTKKQKLECKTDLEKLPDTVLSGNE
jgi:hypothetical protein